MTKWRCGWRRRRCLEEWSTASSSNLRASLPSYQISSFHCPRHPPLHLHLHQGPYPPCPQVAHPLRAAKALPDCWCQQGMELCLASAPLSQPFHTLCLGLYSGLFYPPYNPIYTRLLPELLVFLGGLLHDKQPIPATIKKTLQVNYSPMYFEGLHLIIQSPTRASSEPTKTTGVSTRLPSQKTSSQSWLTFLFLPATTHDRIRKIVLQSTRGLKM